MGAQQSNETVTIDKVLVEQHMEKLDALKEELVIKSEENQFLRKRIMADLTEHISYLEEELKKEKSRVAAQTRTIEKYSQLCRKLEGHLNAKKSENESLATENNRLLFELLLNNEEIPRGTTSDARDEDSSMFQLLKLQGKLQQVKVDTDLVKRRLIEEINSQKRDAEEAQLLEIICRYNQCKEKLQNQGLELGETIFPGMEHDYRILYAENAGNKIHTIKELNRIERDLRELTEQLNKKVAGVTNDIGVELSKHDSDLQRDFVGVSFVDNFRKESDFWVGLMDIARSEVRYFEKIALYGGDNTPKHESCVKLVDTFGDNDDIGRSEFKSCPFDVFEESEA